jgi:ThiF family
MSDRRLRVIQCAPGATDAEVKVALGRTVRVVLPAGTPLWRHQLLALALVDMLGRLFPRIDIVCAPDAVAAGQLAPGPALLRERLEAARGHGVEPHPPGEPELMIGVGSGEGEADIYVDGREWQSYVGTRPSLLPDDDGRAIAVGPLAAACRAAAQAFQRLLGDMLPRTTVIESSYWSALTYEKGETPLTDPDLPEARVIDAALVGAGSIGGAAVYLFAHTPELAGSLEIVDPQPLEEHNPDRALLATEALAAAGEVKALVAARSLEHLPLVARPHQATIAGFVAARPREQTLPLVLSAVDSAWARREIQDCLPLEVVNSACSPTAIAVSGHVTGDGPCVYCLHLPQVLDGERTLAKLIAAATGLPLMTVIPFMVDHVKLGDDHLRQIERHLQLPTGALQEHRGDEIEELYRSALLYGEVGIKTSDGLEAAVAAVFVTALAGFILAGEALKAGAGEAFAPHRLGVRGQLGTKYEESLFDSANTSLISLAPRHVGSECLCRSPRRLRLMRQRYGLVEEVA